jgi:hypothetical protein
MRDASGASGSQPRGCGGPPTVISKAPSPSTSKSASLSTPTVPDGKAPSSAPASTVNETYTAPPVRPRTR